MRNKGDEVAKALKEDDLAAIGQVVWAHPEGVSIAEITDALKSPVARQTLQYRLKSLADAGRIVAEGDGRGAKYRLPAMPRALGGTSEPTNLKLGCR